MYYPFSGNANDESGNGNDGIVIGASLTSDRFSNPNSAYYFDGVDDYIIIDGAARSLTEYAICFWYNTTTLKWGSSWKAGILFSGNHATSNRLGKPNIHLEEDGTVRVTGGWPSSGNYPEVVSDTGMGNGKWHFVVANFNDHVNAFELYVDGQFVGADTSYTRPLHLENKNATNYMLTLGFRNGNSQYYEGMIDDFRIYERQLNKREIRALFLEEKSTSIKPKVPRAYKVTSNGKPGGHGGHPAEMAFDQNYCTNWNSGLRAPRWIAIDFIDRIDIDHIRLRVQQTPIVGTTTHQVLISHDGLNWEVSEEFTLKTVNGNFINRFYYPPLRDVRALKILTVKSPSWIAWKEIEINPEDTLPIQVYPRGPLKVSEGEYVDLKIHVNTLDKKVKWQLDGQDIAGANSSVYRANQTGSYTALIGKDDCFLSSQPVIIEVIASCPGNVPTSENLIINGGFGDGFVEFETEYNFVRGANTSREAAKFTIATYPFQFQSKWTACHDPADRGSPMMIVNGATTEKFLWKQSVPVQPGNTYIFSMKVASAISHSVAKMQVSINGRILNNSIGASNTVCLWKSVNATWESDKNSVAEVIIHNTNLESGGNDFVIDDISLVRCNSQTIEEMLEEMGSDASIILDKIHFDLNSYELKPSSFVQLDDLVSYLKRNPEIKFEIHGHTDSGGPYWFNKPLSENRAKVVGDYLVDKRISRTRFTTHGFASEYPIVRNTDRAGRYKNRRVEFKPID
ncbi:MAG: OmpA family protein [Bacteroidetes bacterium]|nr:OmpA family protein [Bacteroidota bacterium]